MNHVDYDPKKFDVDEYRHLIPKEQDGELVNEDDDACRNCPHRDPNDPNWHD